MTVTNEQAYSTAVLITALKTIGQLQLQLPGGRTG
jgi:hypothetical protein